MPRKSENRRPRSHANANLLQDEVATFVTVAKSRKTMTVQGKTVAAVIKVNGSVDMAGDLHGVAGLAY